MRNYEIYQRKEKLKRCFSWTVMEECLPKDIVIEYKEAFQILDRKKVGKISIRDVSTMVCSIGIRISQTDLLEFVGRVIELNNRDLTENCVAFPQFLATMTSIITNCVPEEEATRIFQEFDKDGDGYISANELRDLLSRLGDDVTDDEIQEMINEADTDGDGLVSLQEFINVMNSAHNSNNNAIEQYPVPRILKDNEDEFSGSGDLEASCSSTCCNENTDDGPIQFLAVPENHNNFFPNEESSSSDKSNELTLPHKCKNSSQKRRKSIIDWLKGSPKDSDQSKLSDTETSSEFLSSSVCSVTSSEEPTISPVPPHLRNRRRSSITKTLKNGKDALVATAKRLRKHSR